MLYFSNIYLRSKCREIPHVEIPGPQLKSLISRRQHVVQKMTGMMHKFLVLGSTKYLNVDAYSAKNPWKTSTLDSRSNKQMLF